MLYTRSPLMKRLAEIMPKKPEQPWDGKQMMRIELHPIRQAADLFASWMGNERLLPANNEELLATLWTFGEILNGEMERMLNVSNRLQSDLLATMPIKPQMIHVSEVGEVTKEQMKEMTSVPPNPTLKFDHVSIDLTDEEIIKLKNFRGQHVDAGRYEWTAGKPLKDCKVDKP